MQEIWDKYGYEITQLLSQVFYWILGLFGIEIPENLPEDIK